MSSQLLSGVTASAVLRPGVAVDICGVLLVLVGECWSIGVCCGVRFQNEQKSLRMGSPNAKRSSACGNSMN